MSNKLPLLTGLTFCLIVFKLVKDKRRPKIVLPPSPRSYPMIGHLFSVPQEYVYIGYMKLAEQLGSELISLTTLGSTIIVLNDREDAMNLLERRSANYSDRTLPTMVSNPTLLDWGNFGSFVTYADRWRMYRRLMNPWLNKKASAGFQNAQTCEARLLLQRFLVRQEELESSTELESELYMAIASTFLRALYGHDVKSPQDRFLVGAQRAIANLGQAMLPANFLVNTFPILAYVPEWVPGASWKKKAREWRQEKEKLINEAYEYAMDHIKLGNGEPIIVANLKSQALQFGLTEEQAEDHTKELAITLFGGGGDTTVATLTMFFIAMLLFPEVQRKAQEELDAFLGTGRLPTIEDQETLKYVGRVVQETLRWAPAAPIAIPHTCSHDDKYRGYDIPKSAILIGNVWAMTRDPEVYENPEVFEPDRFLDPLVPPSPVFGWGRRRCPGIYFAETSLFLVIASVLMTFNICPGKDDGEGKGIL